MSADNSMEASNVLTFAARTMVPENHTWSYSDGEFSLEFENPYARLEAIFTRVYSAGDLGFPMMYIKTYNYKMEDELNGYYTIEESRKLYKKLVLAGFKAF